MQKKVLFFIFLFCGFGFGFVGFLIRDKFVVAVLNTHQANTKMKGRRAACSAFCWPLDSCLGA